MVGWDPPTRSCGDAGGVRRARVARYRISQALRADPPSQRARFSITHSERNRPTMRGMMTTGWRRLAVAFAVACATSAVVVASAAAEEYNKEYEHALSVGTQAYVYGEPLLDMQRVFQTLTSVTVPDHAGRRTRQPVLPLHRTRQHQRGRRRRAERRHAVLDRVAAAEAQPIVVHVPLERRTLQRRPADDAVHRKLRQHRRRRLGDARARQLRDRLPASATKAWKKSRA